MKYKLKNYRPNKQLLQLHGSPNPHEGQVIADLYDEDGNFYRSAIVADCRNLSNAIRYCKERNEENEHPETRNTEIGQPKEHNRTVDPNDYNA